MAPGSQPIPPERKEDGVSVACQTDFPLGGTDPTSTTPLPQALSLYNEREDATVAGSDDKTTMTNMSRGPVGNVVDEEKEGTLRIGIARFSMLSETMFSKSKRIRGLAWRIMVTPKQPENQEKSMGFFLQCSPEQFYSESDSSAWSCKADAEMRLVSQKPGIANFVRKTSQTYKAKENDWGYSNFVAWADVLDENKGYIKDDKVLLEIHIKPEAPQNLMSREDFVKAVDRWYNLAELQMNRNMVDLALEANAQGLKFCKDKDQEMREKLFAQKEELTKKKVIDSIVRIEKRGTIAKTTEPLKQTSLRQLTGAQKTIVSKNSSKGTRLADRKAAMQQVRRKRQELAASKETSLQQENDSGDEARSTGSYSPSSPCYSMAAEEEHQSCSADDASENADNLTRSVYDSPVSEANLTSEEDQNEDDVVSDYSNEDSIVEEMCDENGSLHGSSSPLEGLTGSTADCCRTVESDPRPVSRRDPRLAAAASRKEAEAAPVDENPKAEIVVRQQDGHLQHCEEIFIIETMEQLFQDLTTQLGHNINRTVMQDEYNPEDVYKNFFAKFDPFSEDYGTCSLAATLCIAHAQRILGNLREFHRLKGITYKAELRLQWKEQLQTLTLKAADFTLDLANDGVPAESEDKQTGEQKVAITCYLAEPHAFNECEQAIFKLLGEMGACRLYDLIVEKLTTIKKNDGDGGLNSIVMQLYENFTDLKMNDEQVAKIAEFARDLHELRSSKEALAATTKIFKEKEKSLAESETLGKKLEAMHLSEQEGRRKVDEQLKEERSRLKQETERAEQVSARLRKARATLKKTEEKAKKEGAKNSTLLTEKIGFEAGLKAEKKELEALKKKANEERSKARREKERDAESIRRLEEEQSEKDAKFQREKSLFEEKLKEQRTKEKKADEERKQMQSALALVLERARASEVGQLKLRLEAAVRLHQEAQTEIEAGLAGAEENLKRARTQSDVETMKKSVAEWRSAGEELEKAQRQTKADYESAIDLVSKGTKQLAQIDIQTRGPPSLPKIVRPPPVQPSTPVLPPPTIQTPPAGVIGQPRPGNSRCQVESPRAGPISSAAGTPSAPHKSQQQFHGATTFGWNSFNSPFRSAEPSLIQQPPEIGVWNGGLQMNRNTHPTHRHPIGNWATAPGWQPQQRQSTAKPHQYQRPN